MTIIRTEENREVIELLLYGQNRGKLPTVLLTQDDGTLRNWALLVGKTTTSLVEAQLSTEETGELRTVPLIHDGTNLVRILGESNRAAGVSLYATTGGAPIALQAYSDGKLAHVPHGSDEAANFDVHRTDPNRILWSRPFESLLNLVAVELTNADAVLIDGSVVLGNSAALLYEVWFKVNNIDGTNSATFTVGKDVGAGGGLASPEYWAFSEPVAGGTDTDWIYGGLVAGNDDVRGLASANSDLVIQFKVKRVDTGA